MNKIEIRHWAMWAGIAAKAVRVAEKIEQELNIKPELVTGGMGELSVLVNGEKVAKKGWFTTPSEAEFVNAAKEAIR